MLQIDATTPEGQAALSNPPKRVILLPGIGHWLGSVFSAKVAVTKVLLTQVQDAELAPWKANKYEQDQLLTDTSIFARSVAP